MSEKSCQIKISHIALLLLRFFFIILKFQIFFAVVGFGNLKTIECKSKFDGKKYINFGKNFED